MAKNPPHWENVYENEEEYKFFVAVARDRTNEWRSINTISRESGLDRERVEELIKKYRELLIQRPSNNEYFCYWERNIDLLPEEKLSIVEADQKRRLDNFLKRKT